MNLNIAERLGATQSPVSHNIQVFVPSHDRTGKPIDQARWVASIARTFVEAAGGVTITPPAEGGWLDSSTGQTVWEYPIAVYCHITPTRLHASIPAIRQVLHDMGRETNQGEVGIELDGRYLAIHEYDAPAKEKAA